MKLIAVLSWFDEPVWALAELVASVASAGADAIVAVDGAYAVFPGARGHSPHQQAQQIMASARGCQMEALVHVPNDVWLGNEVEKRTISMTLAHTIARPEIDWLWIVDGDELVTESDGLREALEQTDCDTASLMMDEVLKGQREGVVPMRKFFRAQANGMYFEHNHFTMRSGDGLLLYQGFQTPSDELADCEHLGFVRIDHRRGIRSEARNHAAQTYYDRRKEKALELVPG